MQLEQALRMFKLSADYSREDVDNFYNFELNLLQERLTTGDDAQKRANKQQLLDLQAAYELLQQQQAPADKSKLARIGLNRLLTYLALLIVGSGIIGVSIFSLQKQQQAQQLQQQAERQKLVDDAAAKARESKVAAKVAAAVAPVATKSSINPQQQKLQQLQAQCVALDSEWQKLAAAGFNLPSKFADRKTAASKLAQNGSLTQAAFVYEQYIDAYQQHIDNVNKYMQAFADHRDYEQKWQQLAQRENFSAAALGEYRQKFTLTQQQLEAGAVVQNTREALDGVNLTYKVMIAQGERIAKLRREYYRLKARWRAAVQHNSYYKITPSTQELISQAEQKTIDAADFNKMESQVYQRLNNIFKQQSRR